MLLDALAPAFNIHSSANARESGRKPSSDNGSKMRSAILLHHTFGGCVMTRSCHSRLLKPTYITSDGRYRSERRRGTGVMTWPR